jgi:hypothetical protein
MNRKFVNATINKVVILFFIINCGGVASFITTVNAATKLSIRRLPTDRVFQPAVFAQSNQVANEVEGGDSTIQTSIFNLAKSVIGAGVLSLPSGVAFFADEPQALVPSAIICTIFGLAAAYSFSSVGKVCKETKSKSFQEAWGNSVSKNSAWIITYSITAMCFLASLAYSIIIGDSFTSLAKVCFISSSFPLLQINRFS